MQQNTPMQRITLFGILIVCIFLTSCAYMSTYRYVQFLTVQPTEKEGNPTFVNSSDCIYENEDCIVSYDFKCEGGNAGFCVYNKTDSLLCIDLGRSFFIKNHIAYDYYGPKTVMNTASEHKSVASTVPLFYSVSTTNTSNQNINSVSIASTPIVIIPPRSAKVILSQVILSSHFLSCDLDLYPSDSSSISYSEEDSPIHFGNHITYYLDGTQQHKTLTHDFYISCITNQIEPNAISFIQRGYICDNLQTPDERQNKSNNNVVYDKFINGPKHAFYITYLLRSYTEAYKKTTDFYRWSETEQGWVKGYDPENINPSLRPLPGQ